MNGLEELGGRVFLGNDLRTWAIALAQFALWYTVLPLLRSFVGGRIKRLKPEQSGVALQLLLALLRKTNRLFMFAVATWLSLRWLDIPGALDRWITVGLLLLIWLQVAIWGSATVRHFIGQRLLRDAQGAASLNILRFVGVGAVWLLAFLLLLANLGIDITALVAGLGIGGIAIALAVQNVLGDLLASLSIALDEPFKVGDLLVIGEERGKVEYIGIKSTRLRSLSGEQIIMSNGDLLGARVRNFGKLIERRLTMKVGITYETPRWLIEQVPAMLERAMSSQPKTRFERAHFVSYGDFALNFEAVYFVLDPDYKLSLDIQQAINLRVHEAFEEAGIEFAYPTVKQFNVNLPSPEGGN